MVKIKMCGFTRSQDIALAARAGVDAFGFIFFSGSPRCIGVQEAKSLVSELPPFATAVALFVNPEREEVERVLQQVPIDLLQFHGDETSTFCEQFGKPYIKVVKLGVGPQVDESFIDPLEGALSSHIKARGILVDASVAGQVGGTGMAVDWVLLNRVLESSETLKAARSRLIVAGGLNPDNVGDCVNVLSPYAVDVSSGIEDETPGKKSAGKIQAFVNSVRDG